MRAVRALGLVGVICVAFVGCRSDKPEAAPPVPPVLEDAGTAAVSEPVIEDDSKTFFVMKRTPVSTRPGPDGGTIGKPLAVLSEVRVRVLPSGEWAALSDGGGFVEMAALAETRPSAAKAETLAIDALSRGAVSDARAFAALSDAGSLTAALALERFPPEPVFAAPMGDGGTAEVGQVRYVGAVGSGLRAKAETKAALSTALAVNEAVRVLELSEDWVRAEMVVEEAAADAGTPDAGEAPMDTFDEDAGSPTAPPPPAAPPSGWIPLAHLSEAPLKPEPLLALASEDPSAYVALRVAEALTGEPKLWPKLVTSAVKAGQYTEAVRWAHELAADEAVRTMPLNYVFGCRGRHLAATFVDEVTAEQGPLPKDACVGELSVPACVTCWEPNTFRDEAKRKQQEEKRRARIRKRFPKGPAVRAELPGGLVSSRKLFLYALPITFKAMHCEDYGGEARFEGLVLESGTGWLFSDAPEDFNGQHVLFGALLARDEADARRQLEDWPVSALPASPAEMVPGPSVTVATDDCADCSSCGD
ncbi:MAG TPA: hypothetical protein VEY88_21845 [Archangium sp.]|nr:hypothetical protein [Archangium sp.]